MLRVSPGGKGIRLIVLDDVDLRHRQARLLGKLMHGANKVGRRRFIDLSRAIHRQENAIGIPIGEQVGGGRKQKRNHHPGLAADQKADEKEESGKGRHQHSGAYYVHAVVM